MHTTKDIAMHIWCIYANQKWYSSNAVYEREKNYLYIVGTREDKQENTGRKAGTWYEHIGQILRQIFL